MGFKRRVAGGFLVVAGYLLSPLSWWNDAFVNLPLALVFAWLVSAIYKPAFEAALVVGYWLTNIIGLLLLHKGGEQLLGQDRKKSLRRILLQDLLVSLLYTALIVALLRLGVLKPLASYLPGH